MEFYLKIQLRRFIIINKQLTIVLLTIATGLFALPSESLTRFGCEVNIKSMHEEHSPSICVGSITTWLSLNCDKIFSMISRPKVVLLCLYHFLDWVKITKNCGRKELFSILWSTINTKLSGNLWKGSLVWFRDR